MRTKKQKRILISIMIFSMLALYGFLPPVHIVNAVDSITDAKDTITDSDQSAINVRHDFTFTTTQNTPAGGYIDMVFADEFGDVAVGNINCGTGWTASAPNTETARCTADALEAPGAKAFTVNGMTNPLAEASYLITISNYTAGGVVTERVQVRVAVISDVYMSARVSATLTFTISGVASGARINGALCDATTAATATPFGTLSLTASTTVCQQLSVATNAEDGFSVVVWEDDEMTSDSGSNINSFDNSMNDTGSTTPHAWRSPFNDLDEQNTYGHMGLTSDDSTLSWGGGDPFGDELYAGFAATSSIQVMYHDGPSMGTDVDRGLSNVAYTAEIGALQEAGDYENTLTYICTPQY